MPAYPHSLLQESELLLDIIPPVSQSLKALGAALKTFCNMALEPV